jgi:nicotinamide riboside transporter PnuC
MGTALATGFIYGDPNGDPTNWLSWIDGLMGSVMLFGYLASAFRYRETWYIFAASNVIKIVAWSVAIGQATDMATVASFSTSLTLAIVYLVNATFGLIIWQKSKKENLKEIKL